jgi:hypothetical protein
MLAYPFGHVGFPEVRGESSTEATSVFVGMVATATTKTDAYVVLRRRLPELQPMVIHRFTVE